jgi:G6PDH family F420-dependent oxidoreductase
MPGRFMLGVGSGENLNEHIFGDRWPPTDVRLEMLEEAVEVIRLLWSGEEQSFYGTYYTVEDARIYSLPDELPPILVAGSGPKSAELAGRIGDGFISTSPKKEIIDEYRSGGGKDKLCYGELTMCWAQSEEQAKKTALKYWPTAGLAGELTQELRVPAHFEQASSMVTEEDIAKDVVCGPDPDRVLEKIEEYSKAGFDRVWLHQIGPEQEGFFRFCEKEILPQVKQSAARVAGKSK